MRSPFRLILVLIVAACRSPGDAKVEETAGECTFYMDSDGDGHGADTLTDTGDCDLPPDGFVARSGDCDDEDPRVNPDAAEQCDGLDNDCDGQADEALLTTWYQDADGDGYGDSAVDACTAPDAGWTTTGGDCDDTDGGIYPDAVETCGDGVDDDCDGADTTCPLSGEVDLGGFVKLHGPGAEDDAGRLTDVADVTGDGVDDLFVTTFGAGGYAGGGYLVPGPVSGSAALDEAGYAFVGDRDTTYGAGRSIGLGDVDGDSVGDVAIGVPYYNNAVYVFLGPVTEDRAVETPDLVIKGPAGVYSGHGADLVDLDGDGAHDMVLGAYFASAGAFYGGAVYVAYGPLAGDMDLATEADAVLVGTEDEGYAGRHIRGGGDVDGDGLEDMLIAAPNATGTAPSSGIVYLVLGPAEDGSLDDAQARLRGESYGSALGIGVALAMGDVDGDGRDDIAAGAYYESGTISYGGAAYLVLGPATGDRELATADVVVHGDAANQYAGSSVAIGDADGDGVGDVVVGANGTDTSTGAVYVFSGPGAGSYTPRDAAVTFMGEAIIAFTGTSTVFGDLDADGVPSLVVGATGDATGGANAGAVYVVTP